LDPSALPARNVTSTTIISISVTDFATKIAAALQPAFYSEICKKSTITGLIQALKSPMIGNYAEVFVLTAASAFDYQLESAALTTIANKHANVSFNSMSANKQQDTVSYLLKEYANLIIRSSAKWVI
jgi:hypothetical protein